MKIHTNTHLIVCYAHKHINTIYTVIYHIIKNDSVHFDDINNVILSFIVKLFIYVMLQKLRSINISHSITLLDDEVIYLAENTSDLVNINIDGNSLLSDL